MTQADTRVSADARTYRLTNIDMMRGLVIIIMAIDHVRDYFMVGGVQDPMAAGAEPEIGLYITRWVTHFCAPVFVFLAGTSAGLMAARKSNNALGKFLLTRGLWLIFVEFVIISTAFTFAPFGLPQLGGNVMLIAQVIWAIGASMVVLAGFQYLGARVCLIAGVAILAGHHLITPFWPETSGMFPLTQNNPLWYGLYAQSSSVVGPFTILISYPLIPWIGMILFGFGAAFIFEKPAEQSNQFLIKAGIGFVVAFIVLRALDIYGDANGWHMRDSGIADTVMDFLNVSKYPPSLLFTLMTLGPMAILCGLADRWSGWWKDALVMFGRVPFAFYVAHFFLIHSLSILFGMYQGFEWQQFMILFLGYPKGYGTGLLGVYIAWVVVLVILYPFCKWVADIKKRRKDWWLSYL